MYLLTSKIGNVFVQSIVMVASKIADSEEQWIRTLDKVRSNLMRNYII